MQLLTEPAFAGHFRGLGFPLPELYIQLVCVFLVPPFRVPENVKKNRPVEPTEPLEKPQGSPRHQWRRIHHQSHGWRKGQHVGSPIIFPCFFPEKEIKIHLGRLTWNLQITHFERKMIFQTSMLMFHVNLQGCMDLLKMTISNIRYLGNYDFE